MPWFNESTSIVGNPITGSTGHWHGLVTGFYAKSGTTITIRTYLSGAMTYECQAWVKKI
jgi:hypothetical protein